VQHCCATVVHSEHLHLTVVCWLNLAFLWLYYVLQFMCLIQLFGIILCYSLCVCAFSVLDLASSVLCQEIGEEERLRNDLFCVEWDVKP